MIDPHGRRVERNLLPYAIGAALLMSHAIAFGVGFIASPSAECEADRLRLEREAVGLEYEAAIGVLYAEAAMAQSRRGLELMREAW